VPDSHGDIRRALETRSLLFRVPRPLREEFHAEIGWTNLLRIRIVASFLLLWSIVMLSVNLLVPQAWSEAEAAGDYLPLDIVLVVGTTAILLLSYWRPPRGARGVGIFHRVLVAGGAAFAMCWAAGVSAIEQVSQGSLPTLMILSFAIATLVYLPGLVATIVFAAGLVVWLDAITALGGEPLTAVTDNVGAIGLLMVAWSISRALYASRARSFVAEWLRDRTNQRLHEEVERHRETSQALAALTRELEARVGERTAELERANEQLRDEMRQRAEMEERLSQTQKLEAVGQLAGGIAHDFNNLLTGILGNAEALLAQVRGSRELVEPCTAILGAAERAADLTRDLLAFSRKSKVETRPVDVAQICDQALRLLEHTVEKQVSLEHRKEAGRCVVLADAGQLLNGVLNLAVNARDAMPTGGHLTLVTREAQPSEVGGDDPQPMVAIEVRDTGLGIAPAVRERIFEPFFTTKEVGKGTGLGLAAVYGIATSHGGEVRVASEPGRGSTFTIYLPRYEGPVEQPTAEAQAHHGKGSGTILIVDDEPVVRTVARGLLEHMGYQVLEAADGTEGLDVYRGHADSVDLVIADVIMPEMDGIEMLRRLRETDPELPAIVSSGYGQPEESLESLGLPVSGFVNKPYRASDLAAAVAAALPVGAGPSGGADSA
jgi:signal transduction histidine kinase/CheY-like chemotaxis protein